MASSCSPLSRIFIRACRREFRISNKQHWQKSLGRRFASGSSQMDLHQKTVGAVQTRIKDCFSQQIPFRIFHGSTNSTRHSNHDPKQLVDTSNLNHVISIDRDAKTVVVEPNVPMDALVKETLKHGLVPPVIPEFPGMTVGGSFAGTAGESSSFKHGFFDRTVNWIEVVLADGEVVRCSPTERSDLFYGSVGSMGTLGVATLFEVNLVSTGKYVEVTYLPVSSYAEATSLLRKVVKEDFDYVDGIIFSRDSGVIVVGRLTDAQSGHPVQRFSRAWDPWFYLHAQKKARKATAPTKDFKADTIANETTDFVPVADYLFRYDRGAFWMGSHGFPLFHVPFNAVSRAILNPLMHTREMYRAMHHSGHSSRFIIQDLIMPADAARDVLEFVDESFAIYPLWLCPIRADSPAPMHQLHQPTQQLSESQSTTDGKQDLIINIGVWGPGKGGYSAGTKEDARTRFVEDNRRIEAKVAALGGFKWLYAQTFYTEDEFWRGFDRDQYNSLRQKYKATSLPTIFDKVKRSDYFPDVSAIRGVMYTLLGREHLLKPTKKD